MLNTGPPPSRNASGASPVNMGVNVGLVVLPPISAQWAQSPTGSSPTRSGCRSPRRGRVSRSLTLSPVRRHTSDAVHPLADRRRRAATGPLTPWHRPWWNRSRFRGRDDRDLDRADRNRLGLGSGETVGSAPLVSRLAAARYRSWGSEAGGGRCGALGRPGSGTAGADGRGVSEPSGPDGPIVPAGRAASGNGARRAPEAAKPLAPETPSSAPGGRARARARRLAHGSSVSAGAWSGGCRRSRGKSDRLVPERIRERQRHSLGRRARRAGRFARVRDAGGEPVSDVGSAL